VLAVASVGFVLWAHHNPLATDRKMIAEFKVHRSELVWLVKSYRMYTPDGGAADGWDQVPENRVLMEKLGIGRLVEEAPTWMPNPYSRDAVRQFDADIQAGKMNRTGLKKFATIGIEPKGFQLRMVLTWSGWRLISKKLEYFPETPRVEDGEFVWLF
jgi:hypothetical protein